MTSFFHMGPEGFIYHTKRDCPALKGDRVYHPIRQTKTVPDGRRLCRICERRQA